jgi:hypothetical protein
MFKEMDRSRYFQRTNETEYTEAKAKAKLNGQFEENNGKKTA